MSLTTDEIIKSVSGGGVGGCLALLDLLKSGEEHPGDVEDILAMTADYSSAVFAYPVASVAWAYLAAHGIADYTGDNFFIKQLVEATLDGSLCGKAYRGQS